MRTLGPGPGHRSFSWLRAASADAQQPLPELSLEELMRIDAGRVFGASERLQPVTEAPASVSFITAEEIARYGYRTLADILRGVRGMYVTDDRNFSLLGTRGFAQAGRLQQPDPAAGQRTPRQRQRLRTGRDRRGVRHRPGDVRARRDHPRAGLVALWRQRVLRRRQRHHQVGRVARRRLASRSRPARSARVLTRASAGRRLANGVDVAVSGTFEQSAGVNRLYFPGVRYAGHQQRHRRGARWRAHRSVLRPAALQELHLHRRVRTAAAGRADRLVRHRVQRTAVARADDRSAHAGRRRVRALARRQRGVTLRGSFDQFSYDGTYPLPAAGRRRRSSSAATACSARAGPPGPG